MVGPDGGGRRIASWRCDPVDGRFEAVGMPEDGDAFLAACRDWIGCREVERVDMEGTVPGGGGLLAWTDAEGLLRPSTGVWRFKGGVIAHGGRFVVSGCRPDGEAGTCTAGIDALGAMFETFGARIAVVDPMRPNMSIEGAVVPVMVRTR